MKNFVALSCACITLAGCVQPTASDAPISASPDSLANRLKPGMTAEQVGAIVGPSQSQVRSTLDADKLCLSYVYDEAIDAKYVHAIYTGGVLQSASDGHLLPCDLD